MLSSITATGTPCDAQDFYARFTLDTASEFLFGENLDTLHGTLPIPGEAKMGPKGSATEDTFGSFAQAFEKAQVIITQRARLGYFWPLAELKRDKIAQPAEITKKWLDPIVQRALEEKARTRRAGVSSPIGDRTFLEHLADSTEGPCIFPSPWLCRLL